MRCIPNTVSLCFPWTQNFNKEVVGAFCEGEGVKRGSDVRCVKMGRERREESEAATVQRFSGSGWRREPSRVAVLH